MFYAQFILTNKGPLAKIWLAAHWEKKLSKAQIYETNIQEAVDEIKQQKAKLAIRTTGHLLLGIVRIYWRKNKYLLADCNEAFLKIKMAFRPGQMDLLEEAHDAPKTAITLPEVYQDFDSSLPDFGDFGDVTLTFNQSRIDDITIKDDFITDSSTNAFGNNDFGMDDFGDGGMGGTGGMGDFGITDDDELRFENPRDAESERDFPNDPSLRIREQTPSVEGRQAPCLSVYPDEEYGAADDHIDDGAYMDGGAAMERGESVMGDDIPLGGHAGTAQDDQQSIVDAPESSFALEPLDIGAMAEKTIRQRRQRRRLVVDDQKNISGEEMKQNMADYRDTLHPLDLAPPTVPLMKLREWGNVEQLFHLPGSRFVKNKSLVRQFQTHLEFRCRPNYGPISSSNSLHNTSVEIVEEVRRELNYSDEIDVADHNMVNLFDDEACMDDGSFMDIGLPIGGDSPIHDLGMDHEEIGNAFGGPAEEISPPEKKKRRESKLEKTLEEEETEVQEDEDNRWTKRTQNVLNAISNKIHASEENEILLTDLLTKGSTRKTAAQKFYTLLVLKKWQAIDVRQENPYGDIYISEGPQMNASAPIATH